MIRVPRRRLGLVALVGLVALPRLGLAQESKSTSPVAELVKALDGRKLQSFAARATAPGEYVAALYFPGSQLLVVGATLASAASADAQIAQMNYRDLYIDLNSASQPASRVLVTDLGANGLRPKKDGSLMDSADMASRSYTFDGDWKKAKISEDDYTKAFAAADDRYAQMVQTLLAAMMRLP